MKNKSALQMAAAAASVTGVSATALSSSSQFHFPSQEYMCEHRKATDDSSPEVQRPSLKFAPRFDGLRFIETLITAHR